MPGTVNDLREHHAREGTLPDWMSEDGQEADRSENASRSQPVPD